MQTPPPKRVFWLGGAVKSPPFSKTARNVAGALIRDVQVGKQLSMPESRPMPSVGPRCHELRIKDGEAAWRIIYRIDPDAVLILEVFRKTTRATPKHVIETCQWRLKRYDQKRKRHANGR
jgi:phage-related protein